MGMSIDELQKCINALREMTRQQLTNECDMLQGNVNRMMVTNDMKELNDMYEFACKRIATIYHENLKRLKSEVDNGNDN